jgi:lipoyl-dependent peroxiredoxin
MPTVLRTAEIEWTGSIARGSGLMSGGSGAINDLPLTIASRIGHPEGKTSPEELIAAAHAGCFTMAIGSILAGQGTPPERLNVTATVTLEVSGRPTIASSELDVHGVVPGLTRPRSIGQPVKPKLTARSRELSRGMSRSECAPRWTSRQCVMRGSLRRAMPRNANRTGTRPYATRLGPRWPPSSGRPPGGRHLMRRAHDTALVVATTDDESHHRHRHRQAVADREDVTEAHIDKLAGPQPRGAHFPYRRARVVHRG